MITFRLSEEQEIVRDALHEFARDVMRPIARDCDEAAKLPEEFLVQAWQLGLASTQLAAAHGGGDELRSPVTNALVLEELAWGDATLALAAAAPAGFAHAIADFGAAHQRDAHLPLFCGDTPHYASLALMESGVAFDPRAPQTTATPSGNGFSLTGAKCCVPLGGRASHFLVTASLDGRPEAFIVPADAAGLTVAPEKNLGLHAVEAASLTLQAVVVPASERLGGSEGADVGRLIDQCRAALAAVMVGVSRAVLDYAVPYAKDRQAFGQAIAQKQGIAFKLSDMHIETESTRWLVWKAASRLEQGSDVTRAVHLARAYAAEKCMWIADQGLQVLGGHGFIREHPVEMWFRNARTLGVLDGAVTL